MRCVRFHALLASVVLSLGAALVACSDDSSDSVPVYHDGDSITATKGSQFVVELQANPSTGYSWQAAPNDTVELVSSKQVSAEGAAPGASGEQRMTFKATKLGASTLQFSYARSFEPGVPPANTTTFDLEVV
jgi:predicted secreted protein